jgi:hypothetical protein
VSTSNKVDDQYLPGAGHAGGHHGDDAIRLLVRATSPAVPVFVPRAVLAVLDGLLALALRIECFDELGVEVIPLLGVAASQMRVSRDDRVAVRFSHGSLLGIE